MRGYTYQPEPGITTARSRGNEIPMSPKKTYEVLNAIRGLPVDRAETFLEEVIELKRAVPFRRYNQETAHKKGIGPGRTRRRSRRTSSPSSATPARTRSTRGWTPTRSS